MLFKTFVDYYNTTHIDKNELGPNILFRRVIDKIARFHFCVIEEPKYHIGQHVPIKHNITQKFVVLFNDLFL